MTPVQDHTFIQDLLECATYQPQLLGNQLAVNAFYPAARSKSAKLQHSDNANGQVPSNASFIFGAFHAYLKTLRHENICEYVLIYRGHQDRFFVVSEHYSRSLADLNSEQLGELMPRIVKQILSALCYLYLNGISHCNLTLQSVRLDNLNNVKLADFGMSELTNDGECVSFPINDPNYLTPGCFKDDIWALGLIMLEVLTCEKLGKECTVEQLLDVSRMEKIASDMIASLPSKTDPVKRNFIEQCLMIDHLARPQPDELLKHALVVSIEKPIDAVESIYSNSQPLAGIPLNQLYILWKLSGGDLEKSYSKKSQTAFAPPIERLPIIIRADGAEYGGSSLSLESFTEDAVVLSMNNFETKLDECLKSATEVPEASDSLLKLNTSLGANNADIVFNQVNFDAPSSPTHPISITVSNDNSDDFSLSLDDSNILPPKLWKKYLEILPAYCKLPLSIREADAVYQFMRMKIFSRLLVTFPASRKELHSQASIDIPPLLRGPIWACLLGLKEDYQRKLWRLDYNQPHGIDHQIDVDIPRCHQYNAYMNCPQGQQKLRCLLKAWVAGNPSLVYWQGLDSLCAPFLITNFNDDALAYWSVQQLVPRYLKNFFVNDNAAVIQDYLAVFRQLISFHDPELGSHLNDIGFSPDLYAIPWFLTLFTHIFPLHKILHLWDRLFVLSSNLSTFPVFMGLTILHKLRTSLLSSDFNDCISYFSEMPDFDLAECVDHAVILWRKTPASMVERVGILNVDNNENKTKDTLQAETTLSETNILSPYEMSQQWWNRPVPLELKKNESVARISLNDLLRMGNKAGVFDIRSPEKFQQAHYPLSYNLSTTLEADAVESLKSQFGYFVVLAERGESGSKYGEQLVHMKIKHVALLNGGMDAVEGSATDVSCHCASTSGKCSMSLLDSPVQMV